MINFKREYIGLEQDRFLYPVSFKDKAKCNVYGRKKFITEAGEVQLSAHVFLISKDFWTFNAGQLDFTNYADGIWNDYISIVVVEKGEYTAPSINFASMGDITPENLQELSEYTTKHLSDLEKRIVEDYLFIDEGTAENIRLPNLPENHFWVRKNGVIVGVNLDYLKIDYDYLKNNMEADFNTVSKKVYNVFKNNVDSYIVDKNDELQGATYTPAVSPEGIITFTNDKNKPNPEPVNIKGPAGTIENVTASVNSNAGVPSVKVTMSGTKENRSFDLEFQNLKGDKPIKGTDYYTQQEKEQFTTETKALVQAEGNKVVEQVKNIVAGNPATTNALTLSGKTRTEFEQDLAYTNNAVFKEEYKDITSKYHITHPNKNCIISNNMNSVYNTTLQDTADSIVNIYNVKRGEKFKVTSVLGMGNYPICIYLDSDFKLIQETKKLPSSFGYDPQTNEFIVDNDYPYVLLTSRHTAPFKVEKINLVSKIPTKTSELINDSNFVVDKEIKKYVDNKFITVNRSINLYDSSKSVEGFMSEKDKVDSNNKSYMTSDFIELEKGKYVIQYEPRVSNTARISYTTYDKDKKPLTFLNKTNVNNLIVDMSADGYIRFSTYTIQMKERAMVFKGEQPINEYIPFEIFGTINPVITSDNILWNKKWAVCGDSFTHGGTETKIQTGRYKGKEYTYPYLIANKQNMDIKRFFRGGRTLAYPKDGSFDNSLTCPTSEAYYQNIPVDVDYITIYLGINDSHHATGSSGTDGEIVTGVIPIGTIDDTDTSTYYGAWNVVLTWLIEHRPFAHIGIIVSNGCDTPEYRTAQLSIAKKYGIPYIDLNGDERTPCMIRSQNQEISKTVRDMITKKQAADFDGTLTGSINLHPNDEAQLYQSTFIENFLRSL